MDKKHWHRTLIREIYATGTLQSLPFQGLTVQPIFDERGDHYLLMVFGMQDRRWKHFCLIHIDLVDDKIIIQCDGSENSVMQELLERGVLVEDIDRAFCPETQWYKELYAQWKQQREDYAQKRLASLMS